MKYKNRTIIGMCILVFFMFVHPIACIGFMLGFVMGLDKQKETTQ